MSRPSSRSSSPSRTRRPRSNSSGTRPTADDATTPTRQRANSQPDPTAARDTVASNITAPDHLGPDSGPPDPNTAADDSNQGGRSPAVAKTKQELTPSVGAVQSVPVLPDPTATGPTATDLATHLPDLQSGNVDRPLAAFTALRKNKAAVAKPEWAKAVRVWVDEVFSAKEATDLAHTQPALFVSLVEAARELILDPDLGAPSGFTDAWLNENLAKLADRAAAAVAESLVATDWCKPKVLGKDLRRFVVIKLRGSGLNLASGGLAARFVNLLWNEEEYGLICDLVRDGINTATPAYYGSDNVGERDGAWCGYIQPIEHILGRYLRLAEGDLSLTSPEPGGVDVETELIGFAERSPAGRAMTDRQDKAALGERKLSGAAAILKALTEGKEAKILTSFAAIKNSDLLAAFTLKPGTIWGFEDVRMPYVQAAHAVPKKGEQPVRMWELWEMVGLLVAKAWYEAIMTNPIRYIPELMQEALKQLAQGQQDKPAEYIGRNTADYRKAFETQCTAYLWSLTKLAPRAKYATAEKRGHDVDAYLGSFGCNAGLWWALETKTPVYYCLDGLKNEDLINYKKLKTSRINTFLNEKDPTKRKPYIEGITLAEIREILKRWDKLGGIVRFARQGKFLAESEVLELKRAMEEADNDAGERYAPDLGEFAAEIRNLGPGLLPFRSNEDALSVVAQAQLLRTAANSSHINVLPAYFATKGYQHLVDHGVMPNGFAADYQKMLDTEDPNERKRLAAELVATISDISTGTPRVCDDLRKPLIDAINAYANRR